MNKNKLNNLRHSCSHLLAAAVLELWPKAQITLGPPIKDGFYYDIDFKNEKISEKDFPKIEDKMKKIVKTWKKFQKIDLNKEEAFKIWKDNPYKLELINELIKKGEKITAYQAGNFIDLCRGGHSENPQKELKYFKLLSIAGAYWRGDEKNKMLTRIYGTCFPTKEELNQYLWQIEEAKKRDHRKLGKMLDLFIIPDEVGQGLIIWTPKGAFIRRQIENLIINEQTKRGYQHVYSPHIGKKNLWVASGHWDLYRDKMYSPMKIDKEDYLIKPMNCPMHMMIYKNQTRSYRDLPLRIAEIATVYRYEQSGELSGMLRVRHITQDDAHIFCRENQVVDEFLNVFDLIAYLLKIFKINDYYLRLGLRSAKQKYLGNNNSWLKAEQEIIKALQKRNLTYIRSEGDAAFYGPKLDVIVKDSLNREWQCGTIQVDFMLPERFKLEYINEKGETQRPVLIHRAPLGSLERWVGLLIEHFAGAFPLWLSPIQTVILPVSSRNFDLGQKVKDKLMTSGIRVHLDDDNKTISYKIRYYTLQKIPYMVIIGDKEQACYETDNVYKLSVRTREGENWSMMDLYEFTKKLKKQIENFL